MKPLSLSEADELLQSVQPEPISKEESELIVRMVQTRAWIEEHLSGVATDNQNLLSNSSTRPRSPSWMHLGIDFGLTALRQILTRLRTSDALIALFGLIALASVSLRSTLLEVGVFVIAFALLWPSYLTYLVLYRNRSLDADAKVVPIGLLTFGLLLSTNLVDVVWSLSNDVRENVAVVAHPAELRLTNTPPWFTETISQVSTNYTMLMLCVIPVAWLWWVRLKKCGAPLMDVMNELTERDKSG